MVSNFGFGQQQVPCCLSGFMAFISKIIEKAIATQIHDHLINNDIVDNFQSAYKAQVTAVKLLC